MRRSLRLVPQYASAIQQPPASIRRANPIAPAFRSRPPQYSTRSFSSISRLGKEVEKGRKDDFTKEARELSRKGEGLQDEKGEGKSADVDGVKNEAEESKRKEHSDAKGKSLDDSIGEVKELQARTPWHREGSDTPPVRRNRSAGAMTKGKLLTTPSRLLKLVLPLTTLDKNSDRKDIEPLALLVHPQQPLSYLERLIQSELPLIEDKNGKEKVPDVFFRAEDSASDETGKEDKEEVEDLNEKEEGSDAQMIDGKMVKLGKITKDDNSSKEVDKLEELESGLRGGPGEGGVETYSGHGREANTSKDSEGKFVRWSSSTEIGDFIRDAARGKEFAVEIEGAEHEIRVGVPSFNDRTHYLRVRLRKASSRLATMASLKKECDQMAHRSAQRLALGGFGMLAGWWFWVYFLTFQTSYGWDTMEPVTYLAGLSTIMIGYLWFLYHNREVSYRSALNLTVSKRQNALYEKRGFDLQKWENLIEQANALRKEIKSIADEYDVEWDEKKDEGTEEVHDALREERKKNKKGKKDDDDEGGDDGDSGKTTKGKEKGGKGKED